MIKLIINQSKLESDTPNTFVDLLAWISQIIRNRLPPIFFTMFRFQYQRAAAPLCFGGQTGLNGGLIGLCGSLIVLGGGPTGLGGGQTGRHGGQTIILCIEQNFFISEHRFCFNMKILALHSITRCPLCQIISSTILMSRYMMYAKYIKIKFDHI
jgi:hypothetical protein